MSGGSDDAVGPEILSVTVNETTVAPGDVLEMRAHLRDPSGCAEAGFMYEVGGRSYNWCGWNVSRVSGSIYDGWWSLTCTVPQTARAGAYTVTPYASDSLEELDEHEPRGRVSPGAATFTVSAAAEEIPTQATDVRGV